MAPEHIEHLIENVLMAIDKLEFLSRENSIVCI